MGGAMDRFAPGTQPAGRTPAPGRLGLVQAFGNSFWDLDAGGADEWATAGAFRAWLVARGFAGAVHATDADRRRAIELREALRDLGRRNHRGDGIAPGDDAAALAVLDAAAQRCAVRLRFDPAPRHEPAGDGADDALALVLGVVAEAMADGTWSRMKACPGPHCGWLFYDASRNRSSQWCSMRICGNRVKGRTFRERRRGAAT
jgi:predicted RNA-binding Zn ribbon-like protein